MYEHKSSPLLPRAEFVLRLARSVLFAALLIFGSLGIGVAGYRVFGDLGWIDSILNASMILTGMGPVNQMRSTGAKLFASFYGLFRGVAFLTIVGVLLAPVVHRFLHRFHLELEEDENGTDLPAAPADRSENPRGEKPE